MYSSLSLDLDDCAIAPYIAYLSYQEDAPQ